MPVVAVVNRKGGSGKSTLASHLAVSAANNGATVMLADVDRQQSTRAWLRERNARPAGECKPIAGHIVDSHTFLRAPAGTDLVVVDTPGGLTGLDLARVVMYADAILMPVCNSLFDRESAAQCVAELRRLPRVASGRCRMAAIGMRVEDAPEALAALQAWAAQQQVPLLSALRESPSYVRCAEQGLTLFDLPPALLAPHMAEWQPIFAWLRVTLQPAGETAAPAPSASPANDDRIATPATAAAPVGRSVPGTERARVHPLPSRPSPKPVPAPGGARMGRLLGALPIPRFLQRGV